VLVLVLVLVVLLVPDAVLGTTKAPTADAAVNKKNKTRGGPILIAVVVVPTKEFDRRGGMMGSEL